MPRPRFALIVCSACVVLAFSGCNLARSPGVSSALSTLPAVSGVLHGGQQPVSGALIQLYAANTSVAQGASIPLISSAIYTDVSGGFTITGDYTCPSQNALVYIVASGGNPGLPGTVDNTALALMAVLGTCGSLTSSTFISINELTTAAAVQSLAPFMLDYAHVGVNASNVASLSTAFSSAIQFVDPTTGQFGNVSSNGPAAPTALINTLADIIAACVNTSGGSTGDGTRCGNLLQYTSTNTDTIAAFLSIVRSPVTNVSQLFSLVSGYGPFQPALASAPASFAVFDSLALSPNPSGFPSEGADQLLCDSQGHVWVLRPYAGTLSQYDSNLNLLHTYNGSYSSGGLGLYMTLDPGDNLWLSLGSAFLKISSDGTVLSPATGYPLMQNELFTYNLAFQGFTSDSVGDIWVIVTRVSDSAVCLFEYSSSGVLISPSAGYCGSQVGSSATQVIGDSSGNVYLFFYDPSPVPIEKFSQSGSFVDLPTEGYYGGVYGYQTVVYDQKDQQIWANGWTYLDKLNLDGTVAITSYAPGESAGTEQMIFLPIHNSITVDGGGNYWETTNFGSLVEETSSGTLKAPCTGAICGIPVVYPSNNGLGGIAVNPAGDLFTVIDNPATLIKFPGLAAAR